MLSNIFKLRKKNKIEIKTIVDVFLLLQDNLIDNIRHDIVIWQDSIKYVERESGHDPGKFKFFNSFAFYRLSFLDIVILFRNFLTSKVDLEKQVYAKMLALNLYEFIEDIPQIFSKDFSVMLSALTNNELVEELSIIKRTVQEIKKESHDYLKEIRNTVAGHKDHDSFKQSAVLEKLSFEKIEDICLEIYKLYLMVHKLEKNIRIALKGKINGS